MVSHIVVIVSQPAWPAHYRRQVVEYLVDEKGLDVSRIDDDGMPAAVAAVATFAARCNIPQRVLQRAVATFAARCNEYNG